jgi:transketolase|tara:strand:+ start:847 stop:1818 length:972 start_codon:yes stop_codon:yes gene_type:complete
MIINERNIKMWSTIGSRATFGLAAFDLAKSVDNLMVLTCDVSTSAGLDRYRKTYPEKYLDLGIAEQNMIGVAAGLASEGYKVVTTTFAPFQTMRCCEQIKVNLGYMKQNVCTVGIASGLALGALGYTHCCIEDLSIMRSIPEIVVISPADSVETIKALEAAIRLEKPSYIRLTGTSNNSIIYNKDYDFNIGKSIILKEGTEIVIFSTGAILKECMDAAAVLEQKKVSARVVNMHTIKPIDKEEILNACKSKLIVSVEEHNIIGGLGSAIAEYKSTINNSPPQLFLGINDYYSKGGTYNYLKNKHRLTSEKIVEDILIKLRTLK